MPSAKYSLGSQRLCEPLQKAYSQESKQLPHIDRLPVAAVAMLDHGR